MVLVFPLLMSFVMGVVIVSLSPRVEFDRDVVLRILLMVLSSLIYLLAFYVLGLALSGLSSRSSISLILCLFVWICLTFIIPRVSSALATRFQPAPPYSRLEAQRIQLNRDRSIEENKETTVLYNQWQKQSEQTGEADKFKTQLEFQEKLGKLHQRLRDKYQRQFLSLWEDYQQRQQAQTPLAAGFSRLSLSASYSLLMTELTHTGPSDQQAFMTATMNYHRQLRQVVEEMIEKTYAQMTFLTAQGEPLPGRKPDLTRLPKFTYPAEATARLAGMPWGDMVIVWLNVMIFFTTAYVAFLRYDPR